MNQLLRATTQSFFLLASSLGFLTKPGVNKNAAKEI